MMSVYFLLGLLSVTSSLFGPLLYPCLLLLGALAFSFESHLSTFAEWSGPSQFLIILTLYLLVLMNLSSPPSVSLLSVALVGSLVSIFSVTSLFLFFIFFELSLIPMLLIILGWGPQPERLSASLYMLFYTFTASIPFLGVILLGPFLTFKELPSVPTSTFFNCMSSFLICLPFLVKTPMFLVHIWLPKAHVEAPVYGSMILAGALLKIGSYGLWFLTSSMVKSVSVVVGLTSLGGGVLASLICLAQVDVKTMIAYSSVVHMTMVTTILLLGSSVPYWACLLMLVGHGVCSSGLFYMGTVAYQRIQTRSLLVMQGLYFLLPSLSFLWSILVLMNLSAPPSMTLLSEIVMASSILTMSWLAGAYVGLILIITLCYSLQLFYSLYHLTLCPTTPVTPPTLKELYTSALHAVWLPLSPGVYYLFM